MVLACGAGVAELSGEDGLVGRGGCVGVGDGKPCGACGTELTNQGPAQRGNRAGQMQLAVGDGRHDAQASCVAAAACGGQCFLHLLSPYLHGHLCHFQLFLDCWL